MNISRYKLISIIRSCLNINTQTECKISCIENTYRTNSKYANSDDYMKIIIN